MAALRAVKMAEQTADSKADSSAHCWAPSTDTWLVSTRAGLRAVRKVLYLAGTRAEYSAGGSVGCSVAKRAAHWAESLAELWAV